LSPNTIRPQTKLSTSATHLPGREKLPESAFVTSMTIVPATPGVIMDFASMKLSMGLPPSRFPARFDGAGIASGLEAELCGVRAAREA